MNPDFKVHIVDAILFARKAVLSPTVQMAHIKALENGTAKYPLRPVDGKVYTIPLGAMSHTYDNLFLGTLPKRLILWCVDNNAYSGDYSKKKTSTPRITALTSWPSTSMVVKCRPNRSSQTSSPVTTFELRQPVLSNRQTSAGLRQRVDERRLRQRLHLLRLRPNTR